jgi:pectate lyase
MRKRCVHQAVLITLLLCDLPICLATENPAPNDPNRYLDAVSIFADNVLKYGRDTYGPKHTPLFVDGLNVHTREPVKWIAPNGDRWILSNLASQQSLFRTLNGLTTITSNPKYKQAAMDAIKYANENLRSPNGLLYWGMTYAYDADTDRVCSDVRHHSLRYHYPYYELMWEVTPNGTRDYVESFWASHVLDWSNLDMNRYSSMDSYQVAKSWSNKYRGGPVFFIGDGIPFFATGSDLFYAAALLSHFSDEKEPLVWAKRLAHRYVETRNPKIGISGTLYTISKGGAAKYQLGDDLKGHIVHRGRLFPGYPKFFAEPRALAFPIRGWICMLQLGDALGTNGEEFRRWALEELTAWGKHAYREEDNSLIPMLIDGISLEGYVLKKDGYYGAKGTVFKARHPQGLEFWAYAMAYRITGNQFMWQIARSIAKGNNFGDIGITMNGETALNGNTECCDPYALLGFLELHLKTDRMIFLDMASRIGDNILKQRFHKGFFVPNEKHIYTRFDSLEHLALLHLFVATESKPRSVPTAWPGESCFACDYRKRKDEYDIDLIYTLTDSLEPPISLHEAAALGDLKKIKSLLSEGVDVNSRERAVWTPLHRAVLSGQTQAVELLLDQGADIDARNSFGASALYYAVEQDHKRTTDLLVAKGADINAKNSSGQTPLDIAVRQGHKDIVELLQAGLAESSIHGAASLGVLNKVKAFVEKGIDVDSRDDQGMTPLHLAAQGGHREVVEFLLSNDADVNAKNDAGKTPLDIALSQRRKDVVRLLVEAGADIPTIHMAAFVGSLDKLRSCIKAGMDVDAEDENGRTPLLRAVMGKHIDAVSFLIEAGADVNLRDEQGYVPLVHALWALDSDMVKLLLDNVGLHITSLGCDDGQHGVDRAYSGDGR